MIPPKLTSITKEQIPEAPNWVAKLLQPINLFFSQTWNCLQNLKFGENIVGQVTNVRFDTTGTYPADFVPLTVALKFKDPVNGVIVIKMDHADSSAFVGGAYSADWYQSSTNVIIRFISGLQPSTKYNVRLLIF